MNWLGEVAHLIGAVPLVWLLALRLRGRRLSAPWVWMALGFFVSWIADAITHYVPHPLVSQAYPLTQAALFCAVLVPRRAVEVLVAGLVSVAALSVVARDAAGFDVALHLAAWGAIALCAWFQLVSGPLRYLLAWGFGLLALAWVAFTLDPSWASWSALQLIRFLTAFGWCVLASREARAR